jgi:transposase
VCGDYAVEDRYPDDTNRPPLPRHGHSKDHRPDLKQLVISLTNSGPAQLPIWYEGLDDNSSDKANFHPTLARIKAFRDKLETRLSSCGSVTQPFILKISYASQRCYG